MHFIYGLSPLIYRTAKGGSNSGNIVGEKYWDMMTAGRIWPKTEHMLYTLCHGSLHGFSRSLFFFMTQSAQGHSLTQWHSPVFKFPGAAQEPPWILPAPHIKPGMRLFSWNSVFCFCGTFIIDSDTLNFCFASFCSSVPMAVWILQVVFNKIGMGVNVIVGDRRLFGNASLSCSFSVDLWISYGDCDQKVIWSQSPFIGWFVQQLFHQ